MAEEITLQQKTDIYASAIIEALAIAGRASGTPDINAAISALSFSTAYLIAKIEDRNARRIAEKTFVEALGKQVAAEVNARILSKQGAAGNA